MVGPEGKPVSTGMQSQPGPDRVVKKVLPETVQPHRICALKLFPLTRRLFSYVRPQASADGPYATTPWPHARDQLSNVETG
ncbi:hypothetical protein [Salmonella enterica]|uniref:hypothetical protein n=1 Tax=Salmonella enterica TaxID=28901 RepID=UPI00398C5F85